MFETVAPQAFKKPNRRVFYESLPLSLALHGAVIGAIALTALSVVTFPDQPPRLSFRYFAVLDPPPPPPPPPPPARAASAAPTQPAVTSAPLAELAPTVIPDLIPFVPAPIKLAQLVPTAQPVDTAGGVPGGVEGGVAGGDLGGVKGGTPGGIPGGHFESDGRLHFDRDAALPMYVEKQTLPDYPERARLLSWEDALVLHYIIGKDGRVYDVRTVKKPQHKEFEPAAIAAISEWRFRPMLIDGNPVEVVHELTVYFRLW